MPWMRAYAAECWDCPPMLLLILIVIVVYVGGLPPVFWQAGEREPEGRFDDPFVYCASVGTVDVPGAEYVGPRVPESIARGLRRALQLPADAPADPLLENSYWRCMNGKVYGCTTGANLPCMAKANTDRQPNEAVEKFCAANRNVPAIPMVVTGRTTVYAWMCKDGKPLIVRESVKPDARGFLSNIWYEIAGTSTVEPRTSNVKSRTSNGL